MRKMIEVQHKDFKETAVVPETALKRMSKNGWSKVPAKAKNKTAPTAASGDQKEN